eukprot:gnl/MRDRNA2_/MRDRNA2_78880_c0_seq1.p1 gnl/MRDRNA2_/MRDRNA2_78880_c0~~gnl/MRDRNA2_/MRDRNA2_78880_c0_seq1.p1  ORF type:complete len:242 (-),score=39.04 gnl/MRDRNA2_/MRDRNA2_78880_c0_seq1:125-850(-)
MVEALNGTATIRVTEHGKMDVDELLAVEPKVWIDTNNKEESRNRNAVAASDDDKAEPIKACCAAKTCSSTNKESTKECDSKSQTKETPSRAEARFGIKSFVYRTNRIMSEAKLLKILEEWDKAMGQLGNKLSILGLSDDAAQASTNAAQGRTERTAIGSPLARILRSKGILHSDADPDVAFFWSHAGKCINFSIMGPWPEDIPQAQGGFGARRTELVFIGTGYDETAIRDLLDSCLLPEKE